MLEHLMELTAKNAAKNETDYLNAEGILMCGICRTPKQVKVPDYGQGLVYCMCRCESERFAQERAQRMAAQDRSMILRLRSEAFPDVRMQACTFARDDGANPQFSETARRYAAGFEKIRAENCGLLLYGEPGTGKSFYAACIVNALIDRKIPAFMTNVTEITRVCEPERKEALLHKLSFCELVVIDDIGSERSTEYALEQVYAAIDTRYRSGKPLIVTTNYNPQQLLESTDLNHRRIYDRIQESCTPIEVRGTRRKMNGMNRQRELTHILYG